MDIYQCKFSITTYMLYKIMQPCFLSLIWLKLVIKIGIQVGCSTYCRWLVGIYNSEDTPIVPL